MATVPPAIAHHTILSEQQLAELVKAYLSRHSIAGLRERFKIGKNSLYRHLQRAHIKPNRRQALASGYRAASAGSGWQQKRPRQVGGRKPP